MPTGYTAGVQDGSIKTFREFALKCARAMGACVLQRDDDFNDPPKEQVASNYHDKALADARDRLAKLDALTESEVIAACRDEFDSKTARYEELRAERDEQQRRYESMLADVQAWTPPTKDHAGLKSFMEQQLRESIKFDCGELDGTPAWDEVDAARAAVAKATGGHHVTCAQTSPPTT